MGLLGGKSALHLESGFAPLSPGFEVRTPNAVMGVRGTEFEPPISRARPVQDFPTACATPMWGFTRAVEVNNPLNPKAASGYRHRGYETTVPCEEPPAKPSPLGMNEMLSPAYR